MRLGMQQKSNAGDRWLRRRIDIGQNPYVDEPSLQQHSTAKCTGKPKNDPKNNDERRSPWGVSRS
jgi:hypothetical protein